MEILALDPARALDEAIESIGTRERLVICGPPEEEEMLAERVALVASSPYEIINASLDIDVDAWFLEQRQELEADWEEDLDDAEGDWPGESSVKLGFAGLTDIHTGEPFKEVIGVRIPTARSWELPAHLAYGGWNECPEPEIQCAIWRYWEAKYGAAIIGVSGGVVDAYVAKPPQTEEAAMELAWEQYLYCYDIVEQGVETVANLGAGLINHEFWYFWWD